MKTGITASGARVGEREPTEEEKAGMDRFEKSFPKFIPLIQVARLMAQGKTEITATEIFRTAGVPEGLARAFDQFVLRAREDWDGSDKPAYSLMTAMIMAYRLGVEDGREPTTAEIKV